jgi:hypothetical protein
MAALERVAHDEVRGDHKGRPYRSRARPFVYHHAGDRTPIEQRGRI